MPRSVGEGFREHDPRIEYFIKYDTVQNFGDYLPEIFCKELLLHPRVDADMYRLVGSVIDEKWVRHDLGQINGYTTGTIAFWCCGARGPSPLSAETSRHCLFFGARGPLTRDLLGLPDDTPLGDPGLLAPLFHRPRHHDETAGKSICVPHVHDLKNAEHLIELANADVVISPVISSSEAALREILDKIASADFVLTASLHAAIIACAYGRPFAFWDNGHIDIPFKWEDFASSVGIPAIFVKDLAEGRRVYSEILAPRINIPPLARILDACPFSVHPSMLLRAISLDEKIEDGSLAKAITLLDRLPAYQLPEIYRLQDQSTESRLGRKRVTRLLVGGLGLLLRRIKRRVRRTLRIA